MFIEEFVKIEIIKNIILRTVIKTCISGVTISENAPGWAPGIST